MKHIGLFEGIGGFSLAARWAGWETIAWCEWNEFGQRVLRHHFPEAIGHGDITKTDFTPYADTIDILTGGFPCQPYSLAGKRKGKDDERHLWPEMLRAIREIRPRWVVGENVFGLVNWSNGLVFHEVQADLEAQGYEVFPYVLPAVSVNAPHRRDRIWFVAYAKDYGCDKRGEDINRRKEHKPCNGDKIRNITSTNGEQRTTPHPYRNGFNGSNCQHEIQPSEGGEYALRNFEQMGGDASDTGYTGLERSKVGGSIGGSRSQSQQLSSRFICSTWQNFPTQSPVRFGDDGLSSRLDNITFSKWRNESIKAAGNAIVPQVAYQIFKAINQMEYK